MTLSFRVPSLRLLAMGFLLVSIGAILGSTLIGPASAATVYTRSASCAGLSFYPTDSQTGYNNASTLRVRRFSDGDNDIGVFRCDPGLPNGAVVKKVQFTVLRDTDSLGGVTYCALRRSGLTTATAQTNQDLGRVDFSAGENGILRLTDSSIVNAAIDNANWGYWLECHLSTAYSWDTTPTSGLYGADVIYTITAAKG